MLRLLIADDHEVVRAGLRHILQARPEWEVVAEAADGGPARVHRQDLGEAGPRAALNCRARRRVGPISASRA